MDAKLLEAIKAAKGLLNIHDEEMTEATVTIESVLAKFDAACADARKYIVDNKVTMLEASVELKCCESEVCFEFSTKSE